MRRGTGGFMQRAEKYLTERPCMVKVSRRLPNLDCGWGCGKL